MGNISTPTARIRIDDLPETVPISDAANVFGVTRRTIHNWITTGKMTKIPGTYRIARRELERFLDEYSRPKTAVDRKRGPYRATREMNAREGR